MLREHDRGLRVLLLAVEIGLCGGAFASVAAVPLLESGAWLPAIVLAPCAALALPLALRAIESRQWRLRSVLDAIRNLVVGASGAAVALAALAYLVDAPIAPRLLLAATALQLVGLGLLRLSIMAALRLLRRRGRNYRNVLVIGSGPRAREFTDTLARHPEWGLRLIGYVDEGDTPLDPEIPSERVYKMMNLPELIRDEVIDEVIAACPRSMLAQIGPVVEACSAAGLPLTVMNDLFGDYLPPPKMRRFGSLGALTFAPVHHPRLALAAKRLIDILGAALGLIVASPVLLLAALAIKAFSPGPVIFRQVRSGLYGRPFVMYKLRTMVCDAADKQKEVLHLNEMGGPVFKIRRDPRVTRVGRLLRMFSIDELPQFWNVLVGDMSLVGPRPPIPAEVAQYKTWERRRLSMRPGLTCLWQVSGRNVLDFDEWVRLDLEYIDTWSIGTDLRLLAMTIPAVLAGTGH
jgi:exopolysaccharide biosynthesis polyprenyl glycosylphosphotransferase